MRAIVTFLLAGAILAGCNRQPYVTESRLDKGLVVFLTGIEGRTAFSESICKSLNEAGVDWAILLEDWTSTWGPLPSLQDRPRNRRVAAEIAERIRQYQRDWPGRPVIVIGQSGGGGMATWVAESMGDDVSIDGMILLVPALSPAYDLRPALRHCRKGVVNFHSNLDWVILGLGTSVYGTMDRQHTASAGMVGFDTPTEGRKPGPYAKLFQIKWGRDMIRTGYLGGHLTSGAPAFVKGYVAPLVLAPEWNLGLIESLLAGSRPSRSSVMSPDGVIDPARPR